MSAETLVVEVVLRRERRSSSAARARAVSASPSTERRRTGMIRLLSSTARCSSSPHTFEASESGESTKTMTFADSIPAQTLARQSDAPPRMSSTSIQSSLPRSASALASRSSTKALSSRAYEMKTSGRSGAGVGTVAASLVVADTIAGVNVTAAACASPDGPSACNSPR